MPTPSPLQAWLAGLGLDKHLQTLLDNDVDLDLVAELSDAELRELDFSLGDRKRFLKGAAALRQPAAAPPSSTATPTPAATPPADSLDQAQRRQLTVMFCDLVGSTSLSERMDPEDLRSMTHAYQKLCNQVIEGYEGSVVRLLGDGVLSYFGFPQAHEDDTERGVRAALSIIERLDEIQRPADLDPLRVRIGIATGPVVVTDLDRDNIFKQGDVFGETPNLAARLQGLAEPNGIVVSNRSHQLALGCFDYVDLGWHDLKGFSEPVHAWQVSSSRRSSTRFDGDQCGQLATMVGRQREQDHLWQRWQRAEQGQGQVVIIRGEAGIGKSRLARSLSDRITDQQHFQLLNQCSPYHVHNAFSPFIFELERVAGIQSRDPDPLKLDKLAALDPLQDPDAGDALAIIATLLSIELPDSGIAALGPDHLKARTLEVLLERIAWLATRRPLLFLVEDAHWIDPSSQEFLGRLIHQIKQQRILLIITGRPEFTPGWEPHSCLTELNLQRLDADHAQAIVRQLSDNLELPPAVSARILNRADGNPLFIEEITRLVLDSKLLEKRENRYLLQGDLSQLAIPDTLHDSLMARIDRLSVAREVAQIGATLGRYFSLSLITEVSDMDHQQLLDGLTRLVDAGLLFRRDNAADGSYQFKHALVQEAAYQSLLKSRRRQIHALAVDAYMRRSAAQHNKLPPDLLARHCTGAGQFERAIPCWQQAADLGLAQSAYSEAIGHLNAGLELIEQLPPGDRRDTLELNLLLSLGIALTATHGYGVPEVRESYARAALLARRVGQSRKLFPALYGLWWGTLLRADYEHSKELGRELLAQAEASGVAAFLLSAHRALGATLFYTGDFAEALQQQELGLAIPDTADNRSQAMAFDVVDPWVTCQCYRSGTLWMLGQTVESLRATEHSLQTAEGLNHPFSLSLALGFACWISQFRHDRQQTQRYAEAAVAISREHGFPFWSGWGTILGAWATPDEVDHQTRIGTMNRGLKDWQGSGTELGLSYFRTMLADALGRSGDYDTALTTLAEAQQGADRMQEFWWTAEMHRMRGELLLGRRTGADTGDRQAAASCFHRAIDMARAQQALTPWLRAAVSLARLRLDQGEPDDAAQVLNEALANEVDSEMEIAAARVLLASAGG